MQTKSENYSDHTKTDLWHENFIIKYEQDMAYEESLKADQEKDRQRKRELEKEQQAREAEEFMQLLELERIINEKERAIQKVPKEPEDNNPQICHLLVKLAGETMKRKFLLTHTVQDVHNWIFGQPDTPANFEIATSFPRKILYPDAKEQTLVEAGLANREALHVCDLDN